MKKVQNVNCAQKRRVEKEKRNKKKKNWVGGGRDKTDISVCFS